MRKLIHLSQYNATLKRVGCNKVQFNYFSLIEGDRLVLDLIRNSEILDIYFIVNALF